MSFDLTSLLTTAAGLSVTASGTAAGLTGGMMASEGQGGEETGAVSFGSLLTALTSDATVAAPVQGAQIPQATAPQVQASTDAVATLMAAQTAVVETPIALSTKADAPQIQVQATIQIPVPAPVVVKVQLRPQATVETVVAVATADAPVSAAPSVELPTPAVTAPIARPASEAPQAVATDAETLPVAVPKTETALVQTSTLNVPVVTRVEVTQSQTAAVETVAATMVEAVVTQPVVVQPAPTKPVKTTKVSDDTAADTKAVAEKTTDDTVAPELMAGLVALASQAPAPVSVVTRDTASQPASAAPAPVLPPVMPQVPQDQVAANPPADDQSAPQVALPQASLLADAKSAPAADFASLLTATDQKTVAKTDQAAPATVPVKMPDTQSQQVQASVSEAVAPPVRPAQVPAQAPVKSPAQTQPVVAAASIETVAVALPVATSDTASAFTLVAAQSQGQSAAYMASSTAETATPQSAMSQTAIEKLNALSVQINKRHAEGATKFTMELHPADLGRVDVALTIAKDGKLTAHMSFDSAVTAETFSAHEADLRKQLSATGLALADDALTFTSRAKPEATVVAAQSQNASQNPTQNQNGQPAQQDARAQDGLSQQNPNSQQNQQQQQQALNDQQGQNRHNAQQAARALAQAGQAANDIDMDATLDAAMASLKYRQPHSSLALNLIV